MLITPDQPFLHSCMVILGDLQKLMSWRLRWDWWRRRSVSCVSEAEGMWRRWRWSVEREAVFGALSKQNRWQIGVVCFSGAISLSAYNFFLFFNLSEKSFPVKSSPSSTVQYIRTHTHTHSLAGSHLWVYCLLWVLHFKQQTPQTLLGLIGTWCFFIYDVIWFNLNCSFTFYL